MSELQEYKCPCCGGGITFDSKVQKMKCPYCGTEFEMDTLLKYDEELNSDAAEKMDWENSTSQEWGEEADDMKVYSCDSCGGEVVADETTAATFCPYCGNPVIMKGSIKGTLKPEYIIPFKYDKKSAMERFASHLKGKRLLPRVFKSEAHIQEIKGLYVPYWIFDTKADAHMRYKATRTSSWSDSEYVYTKTSYYAVMREGDIAFAHVPVDGSSKMPDDMMESIEPFDFSEAVPFQSAYFSGYYADKYDVDRDSCAGRANDRVRRSTDDSFRSTVVGYTSVVSDGGSIQLRDDKASYAMYPVWLLTTKWHDQTYLFAMNGQTGKFVGDLPVDKSAMWKYFFGTFAGTAAVVLGALSAFWALV